MKSSDRIACLLLPAISIAAPTIAAAQSVTPSGLYCQSSTGQWIPCISGGFPTTIATGTIATTNSFQSVLAQNSSRKACTIQNQGTHTMYAYFGPNGNAGTTFALQLGPGLPLYCNNGAVVATDNVSLSGTAGDAYVVNSQ